MYNLIQNLQVTMYAAGTDVFSDILNGPRYQGCVTAIKGVTAVIDNIMIFFISVCAFFIISCALMKNVVAGTYASYPRLFDQIHDAKLFAMDNVRSHLGTMGPIVAFILGLLPDIKEMSEFKDDTIEPKDYFLKAIPQMICAVMIGVTIYNGYYRDIVVKVAQFGSTMIERILFKVDPVQVFDNLTNGFGTPTLGSDASDDSQSKLISNITKKMYAKTISFYTDVVTAEAKTSLASKMEAWTSDKIKGLSQYTDDKKYKASYQIDRILGDVDMTTVNKITDEEVVQGWIVPYSEFNIDSGEHLNEDWRLRVIVRFNKRHDGAKSSGTITNVTLNIPASCQKSPTNQPDKMLLQLDGGQLSGLQAGKACKIGGCTAEVVTSGSQTGILIYGKPSGSTLACEDLYYSDSKSASNIIRSISIGGSNVTYHDNDGVVPDWKPGDTAYTADEKQAADWNSGKSTNNNSNNSNTKQ